MGETRHDTMPPSILVFKEVQAVCNKMGVKDCPNSHWLPQNTLLGHVS